MVPLTITILHECTPAILSPVVSATNTFSYTIASAATPSILGLFSFSGAPVGVTCFAFNLIDTGTGLAVTTFPSYITYSYPSLTLGSSVVGAIGQTPSIIYSWAVQCYNIIN